MCYGCTNPSMSCAGIASGSVQLGLVLRSFKSRFVGVFGAILDILVVSAPDPAGPNAGFAALDGVGAGTSRHYPRIRKGSAQLPLGIPPYPGDRVAPKLVADAPDGGCQYCILASLRGR